MGFSCKRTKVVAAFRVKDSWYNFNSIQMILKPTLHNRNHHQKRKKLSKSSILPSQNPDYFTIHEWKISTFSSTFLSHSPKSSKTIFASVFQFQSVWTVGKGNSCLPNYQAKQTSIEKKFNKVWISAKLLNKSISDTHREWEIRRSRKATKIYIFCMKANYIK